MNVVIALAWPLIGAPLLVGGGVELYARNPRLFEKLVNPLVGAMKFFD
jgi:hypothetical protein